MSRRNRAIRDRRLRLLFWVCLLAILVYTYLCHHPILWKQEAKVSQGVDVSLDSTSDFLLVVDDENIPDAPETFANMAFSHAWLNTLQQEIGPVSVQNARHFAESELSGFRVVILTRSTANRHDWIPKLRSFLERGGTVVLEMPLGKLRTLASADGKGGLRKPQTLTYANGLLPELQSALSSLKLSDLTQIIGSAGPLDGAQTWMTIDGVPVIYSKNYAAGRVVTLDFDYGMLLTALQQGRPLDDLTIRNIRGTLAIETQDLARTDTTNMPIADILERFLVYGVLDQLTPITGFWPFFDGLNGALLVTHRENGMGDAAFWMAEYESTLQAASTLFVDIPPTISETGLGFADKFHTEIGMSFDISAHDSTKSKEPLGLFKFSPIWRVYNLAQQTQILRDNLPNGAQILSSQAKNGVWTQEYTRAFRMIAAADFRADASYSAPSDKQGYAFGTGFPFIPIDTNGRVFNILEFPIIFPSLRTNDELDLLKQALDFSEKQAHEVIAVGFAPGDYPLHPDYEFFDVWKNTYQSATEHGHWITNISNYFRFSRARFTGELRSKLVSIRNGNKTTQILRLEVLAPENGMSLTVPNAILSRRFLEARRGLQRIREDAILADPIQAKPVTLFGYNRLLIPLTRGFNAIDVLYE